MARVLVLSPHPDDEAIGCGGTLRRHSAAGDEICVIFLTSGDRGSRIMSPDETASVRESEARAAAVVLGIAKIEFLRMPDGRLRSSAKLVANISEVIGSFRPDYLYTTHAGEAHNDHRVATRVAMRALATSARPWPSVRFFEVWTPLQRPTRFENITAFVEAKTRAVRCYASQCCNLRFDEACLALNRYRGVMHSEGEYAEAFVEAKASLLPEHGPKPGVCTT